MNELFPVEESLSPRLKFLREHQLTLTRNQQGQWECRLDDDTWGAGHTQDDAILDLCECTGLRHYSLDAR